MFANQRLKQSLLMLSAVAALTACASSHVLVGQARSPIRPEQVKLYLSPPEKYEEIAILESSSKNSWVMTDQQKMNKATQRLKMEAAKLGANGILLRETGDQRSESASHKHASGIAIYVPTG
jgi:hypothetical protein